VYINNPVLTREEFYESLVAAFGLPREADRSKAWFVAAFDRMLRERHARGASRPVLVIDEAQSLPPELLEEIRLLANIETDTAKLLLVILTGQPELAERLNDPGLRQLKQRVALRCQLDPLSARETAGYIAGRIRVAGGNPAAIFSREAVLAVDAHARGIPRTISVICGNALLTAFAVGQRPITADIITEVARDFDLARPNAEGPREIRHTPSSVEHSLGLASRLTRWARRQEPA